METLGTNGIFAQDLVQWVTTAIFRGQNMNPNIFGSWLLANTNSNILGLIFFWQIWIWIYSDPIFLTNSNIKIFGLSKKGLILVGIRSFGLIFGTTILIHILSHSKWRKNIFVFGYNSFKCMLIICAIIWKFWCFVYNNKNVQYFIILFIFFFKYEYKHIWVDKKGRIPTQIYLVWRRKKANTNTNIFGMTKKGKSKYKYEYSD